MSAQRLGTAALSWLALLALAGGAGAQDLSIGDVTVAEGNAGTVDAVFAVTMTFGKGQQVTVDYQTQDGSATVADNDYLPDSGTLTFTGQVDPEVLFVTIPVVGDTNFELDEVFFVNLSNAMGGQIVDGQGIGEIQNDDALTLSIDDVVVSEGNTGSVDAIFTVTLSEPPLQQNVTVDFATQDGTATVGDEDYDPTSGTLLFPAPGLGGPNFGPVTQQIAVTVNGDTRTEPDEFFTVALSNASGATIVDGRGTGTILNDDVGEISIDDVTVTEGDSGTVDAVFTLSMVNPSASTVTVNAATRNGTATSQDEDYVPVSTQVSIPAGETTAQLAVRVRGDTRDEPDESFFVDLSNPSEGTIVDGEGRGTIVDDDEPVSELRLTDPPPVGEAGGPAVLTVVRTGSSGAARVTIAAASGTATEGEDFGALSAVLSWASGESGPRTAELAIVDDNLEEPDETVAISLSGVVGAVIVGPSTADLMIQDDDVPMGIESLSESQTLALVNSEVGLEVRVQREDGSPVQGATVHWTVEEGDAELTAGETTESDAEGLAANDVVLGGSPGTVVISAALEGVGQAATFEITVQGDLEGLVDPATNPGEASIAAVFDESCIEAEGPFADACEYLFGLTDPADRLQVLRELAPREVAAQGTLTLDAMRIQLRNINGRLSDLRGGGAAGGSAGAADQLAFRSGRDGFNIAQLRPDARTRSDAAFLRRLEGDWWNRTLADEGGGGGATVLEEDSTPRWSVFVNGSISMGDRAGTAQEEGFDLESSGVTAGVDRRVGHRGVIGGALGLLDTEVSLERDGGGLGADGLSATLYALYYREAFYLSGVATFGSLDLDLERVIDLPEPFGGSDRLVARAATDASQVSIAVEAGYDHLVGAVTVSSFARLSSVDADIDAYSENGAGPFALALLGQDVESLLAEAGVQWGRAVSRSWGVMQPTLHAAWLHEFEDSARLLRGRFVEDVEAREFVLPTDTPDRDYLNVGAGLTFTLPRGRSLFVLWDTDLEREDLDVYTLSFGLRWEL